MSGLHDAQRRAARQALRRVQPPLFRVRLSTVILIGVIVALLTFALGWSVADNWLWLRRYWL